MLKRICLLAVVTGVLFGVASRAALPSAQCSGGQVPPSTTPAGVGVLENGTPPGAVDVTGCNDGAIPVHGAARVHVDPNSQSGYVDVTGDQTNASPACAQGFVRVMVNSGGPHFYESPKGNYYDTDPAKKGNQQAKEEAPQTWAQNVATNCGA